jgi:peroxiredoxin (alkyl hydroperoxide reductase subunit C)
MPQVGGKAPSFELEAVLDDKYVTVNLDDYRGRWVVLFFYPLDFTFVCPTELRGFSAKLQEFEGAGAQVLACSTDSKESHLAWLERDFGAKLGYPLLADQRRQVSRDYDVYLEDDGHTLRATFIIDPEGTIRYALMHDTNIGRSTDEILRSLQALQTGELCPVDWLPGEATLTRG